MMPEWGDSNLYDGEGWDQGELAYTPYVMNPFTHSFKQIRPPPTDFEEPLRSPTLTSLQGNVYLVGGDGGPLHPMQDKVHVYDHRIDAWFSGPKLPMELYCHTAVSMDSANLLLTLGGAATGIGTTDAVCSCDPRQRGWMLNPTLPLRAYGVSAAAVDDHTVLALGGRCRKINEADGPPRLTPHLLDIGMWQWRPCPAALPESYNLRREFATAVIFQGKVVVVGGVMIDDGGAGQSTQLSSDVLAYSAEGQGRWEMLQPLPVGLERPSLAVVRVPEGTSCVVPQCGQGRV